MSYSIEPPPKRLKIWQQNLNKLEKVQFDLINSSIHRDWDLLLLQEPYIDKLGNTKATSKWHTLYPSSHLTNSTTNRSVVLVNAALDTNAWAQVPFEDSNDVTVIRFHLPQGQLTLFNIYNDCTHSNTLRALCQYLDKNAARFLTSEDDRMIWLGNFNCHHPLWDKERNKHLFTASAALAVQPLMSLIEDYNMVMLLPKNIPTLQSLVTKNWTRVDNVFATANMGELVVMCDTDPRSMGPGMDHVPMLTTLDISVLKRKLSAGTSGKPIGLGLGRNWRHSWDPSQSPAC